MDATGGTADPLGDICVNEGIHARRCRRDTEAAVVVDVEGEVDIDADTGEDTEVDIGLT